MSDTSAHGDLSNHFSPDRKLVAVVYADLVGYSRLIELDDKGTLERLRAFRRDLIVPQAHRYGGELIYTGGDSLMLVFKSIVGAALFAIEVQRQIPVHESASPPDRAFQLRIGIDIGDVVGDGGDIHGNGLIVAVRLQAACPVGAVCVSRAVRDHIQDRVGVSAQELGMLALKNMKRPVDAFVLQPTALLDSAPPAEPVQSGNPTANVQAIVEQIQRRLHPGPQAGAVPALASAAGVPALAVLPFQQFGGDPVARHLSDGMVADMVCQLAGLRELSVISHGSTLGFRDQDYRLSDVARALGVRYIVRGAIRRTGGQLRLNTELAEPESGLIIWAHTADLSDPPSFDDQDRLVAQIVNTLAPSVREAELRRIRGKRPENLTAYEMVLLARQRMQGLDRDGFDEAKGLLDRAIKADPDYGEAYALTADWHGLRLGEHLYTDIAADLEAVEQMATAALALDPNNVRALTRYGHRRSLLHRDYAAALAMFDRALDVSPSSAHAWLWSSFTYSYLGNAAEAIRRVQRALQLSPRDPEAHYFFLALCIAHYTAGSFEEAVEWGQRALSQKFSSHSTHGFLIAALSALRRFDEAKPHVAAMLGRQPRLSTRLLMSRHPFKDEKLRMEWGNRVMAAGLPP